MAFINHATKNVAIKIVYYGPGLSGKTTNLRYIHSKLDPDKRGDLVCLETDVERTYFFDLLPIKAGLIGDFRVHFQLLTVPGQMYYDASRKSVLKGADGIVFVADSQVPLLDANLGSFDNLRRNCVEHGIDLNVMPMVFQYNKRDLNPLIPVETFNSLLNPRRLPYVEAVALDGIGVFEALREIAKLTVPLVREQIQGEKRKGAPAPKVPLEEKIEEMREVPKAGPKAKKEDIEFIAPAQASSQVKKIRIKSTQDIEAELEKLAKEFTGKSK